MENVDWKHGVCIGSFWSWNRLCKFMKFIVEHVAQVSIIQLFCCKTATLFENMMKWHRSEMPCWLVDTLPSRVAGVTDKTVTSHHAGVNALHARFRRNLVLACPKKRTQCAEGKGWSSHWHFKRLQSLNIDTVIPTSLGKCSSFQKMAMLGCFWVSNLFGVEAFAVAVCSDRHWHRSSRSMAWPSWELVDTHRKAVEVSAVV